MRSNAITLQLYSVNILKYVRVRLYTIHRFFCRQAACGVPCHGDHRPLLGVLSPRNANDSPHREYIEHTAPPIAATVMCVLKLESTGCCNITDED